MMRLSFKEWLRLCEDVTPNAAYDYPDGGGEIWQTNTNADRDFGRTGTKSKTRQSDVTPEKADFDPDELYLGKQQKKGCKKR